MSMGDRTKERSTFQTLFANPGTLGKTLMSLQSDGLSC